MNTTKSTFLIQDLEVLSGIKAHTIRIWEKRYSLFEPDRKNRNVRVYDLASLQKILNISVLNNAGHKISAIAQLSNDEIALQAKETALKDSSKDYAINSVLMAMFSFDEAAFDKIYKKEIKKQSFKELFVSVYAPVLRHIGVLWQTDAIQPIHEHFITNLLYQKITLHTHQLKPVKATEKDAMHILFLAEGEMHQIGLLFLNYVMRSNGLQTIYLGSGIPVPFLEELKNQFKKIIWVNRMVVDKTEKNKALMLDSIIDLLEGRDDKCWLIGRYWSDSDMKRGKRSGIEYFDTVETLAMNKSLS